jgi:hypothetical protein
MIVSEHIKELVPANFYSMGFKFFLQAVVQVSATATFPYFPFLFDKPNNDFFLYCGVGVLMEQLIISLFASSKH